MPTIRKRGLRRLPTDFAAIGPGEVTRWNLGQILVAGEITLRRGSTGLTIWPSWSTWVVVYERCREAFLRWYAERHPGQMPGAELLYEAILEGHDPADVVIPRPPDPRLILAGKLHGSV